MCEKSLFPAFVNIFRKEVIDAPATCSFIATQSCSCLKFSKQNLQVKIKSSFRLWEYSNSWTGRGLEPSAGDQISKSLHFSQQWELSGADFYLCSFIS